MLSRLVIAVSRVLQRVEEWLLSASVMAIAAMTILNVACRSLVGDSLAFAEEISQFCIIVVCFVGLSYAASKGRHIRMTAIYDQLQPAMRKVFMVVITGSTAMIMFVLCWYACQYVATVYELGGIYPVLRVPFYIVYAIAPVGLFLAGIQYTLALIKNLSSRDVYLSFEHLDEYEEPVTREI